MKKEEEGKKEEGKNAIKMKCKRAMGKHDTIRG